jgi:hypothetical protein
MKWTEKVVLIYLLIAASFTVARYVLIGDPNDLTTAIFLFGATALLYDSFKLRYDFR